MPARATQPHIPDALLHSNDPEVYRGFLRGLFEADGTVTAGVPTFSSTAHRLRRRRAKRPAGARVPHHPLGRRQPYRVGYGADRGAPVAERLVRPAMGGRDRVPRRAQERRRHLERGRPDGPARLRPRHPCTRRPAGAGERSAAAGTADGAPPRQGVPSNRHRALRAHRRRRARPPALVLLRQGEVRRAGRRGAHLRPVGSRQRDVHCQRVRQPQHNRADDGL